MTKLMRTMRGEIQIVEIDERFVGEYLKKGWAKAPESAISKVKEPVITKQADYDELDTDVLIGMAVENGMKKIKALKTSKEDLITFLKS